MKPKLYYRVDENGVPFDNFCSDAAIGANDAGIEAIPFSDIKQVNMNPYNIVVTSVEESLEWLCHNIQAIDDKWQRKLFRMREKITNTLKHLLDWL